MTYIYKITNLLDGKIYVGLTMRSVARRLRGWRPKVALEFGITVSAVKDIVGNRAWV